MSPGEKGEVCAVVIICESDVTPGNKFDVKFWLKIAPSFTFISTSYSAGFRPFWADLTNHFSELY